MSQPQKDALLNIERNERICLLCNRNELGDEFNYMFNCDILSQKQNQILPIWSFRSPNSLKKSMKKGKDQESIQSSTTPDPGYLWESDNFTNRHHKREPRGQPFPSR